MSMTSPSPLRELMCSFSNRTSMPSSFRWRTVSSRSTVFRANLEMLFVRMISIFPASQSSSIRWNSSRLEDFVPVTALSA